MESEKIPYIVYESAQTRSERIIHKLVIAVLIAVGLLFLSNALWLYAWMQYDYEGSEITVDSKDGIANYIGNSGVIRNGEDNSQDKDTP